MKLAVVPALLVALTGCEVMTGGVFVSMTKTVNEFVALKAGEPSSVTIVVIRLVPGPWAGVGVQVMIPFISMAAPAGGLRRT